MSNEDQQSSDKGKGLSFFKWGNVNVDTKRAFIGGGLAAVITLSGAFIVGEASGSEAYRLLEVAISATRSFSGTITLATGNILALMLTLISLTSNSDVKLKRAHYTRVEEIAWVDTLTFIGAILIYLLLNIPISESEPTSDPAKFIAYFYYATLVMASMLGGAVITVILMLFNAVTDIIHIMSPKEEETPTNLVITEEDEGEEE